MNRINIFRWIAVGLLLSLGGCGGTEGGEDLPATVDATGVITLDGNPVVGASIVCVPSDGSEHAAFSSSDSKGRFDLKSFEAKSGAVPGSYQVQVSRTVEITSAPADAGGEDAAHAAEAAGGEGAAAVDWENDLPKKYSTIATSELTIDVPETGTSDLKLELSTATE